MCVSHWVLSDSVTHGLWPARLLCPWESPGRSTGGGCHALLQGTFPTQGLTPGLLHCRQILDHLSYQESLTLGKHIKKIQTNDMMNAIVSSLIPGLTELFEHEFFFFLLN